MCHDHRSMAGEGGQQEHSRGAGMLPVLGHCGGPLRQRRWAVPGKGTGAQSTGDVNCCSLPEINTAMLIYTQESVAKYARSEGTT